MKKLVLGLLVVLTMIMFMGCSKKTEIVLVDSMLFNGRTIRYFKVESENNENVIEKDLYYHGLYFDDENFVNYYFVNKTQEIKISTEDPSNHWVEAKRNGVSYLTSKGIRGFTCSPNLIHEYDYCLK